MSIALTHARFPAIPPDFDSLSQDEKIDTLVKTVGALSRELGKYVYIPNEYAEDVLTPGDFSSRNITQIIGANTIQTLAKTETARIVEITQEVGLKPWQVERLVKSMLPYIISKVEGSISWGSTSVVFAWGETISAADAGFYNVKLTSGETVVARYWIASAMESLVLCANFQTNPYNLPHVGPDENGWHIVTGVYTA